MKNKKDSYHIVLLPGDGIGIEVAHQAHLLLETIEQKIDRRFSIQAIPCGGLFYLNHGSRDWPETSEQICHDADVILLGAVGHPSPTGQGPVTMADGRMAGYSPVIGNRLGLDLYANVRPIKLLPGIQHRISETWQSVWNTTNVDMVIVRENTEGLYGNQPQQNPITSETDTAIDVRTITKKASERIILKAFDIAQKRNGAPKDQQKRVTCIVKHNVLQGCKLFANIFKDIGAQYPDIEKELVMVDAFTQFVLTQPEHYDVCVTTNMFGDIVTDLASVLQGGMGMAVGCNLGDNHAMFEPIHGSAPPLAGQDSANPMAMLLATGSALTWLADRYNDTQLRTAGDAIDQAIATTVKEGKTLTADLTNKAHATSLSAVGHAIRHHTAALLT